MRHFSLLVGASALLAVGAQAQGVPGLGQPINGPGGNWVGHVLNVQNIASANAGYTANGGLGVSWAPNNHYYVSARRNTASTANPHQLFEFDTNGNWVAAYAQPAGTLGSSWGIRDLAWDGQTGATSRIHGGAENGATLNTIFAFDWTTAVWDAASDVSVAAPINSTCRALTVVPDFPVGASTVPAFVISQWGEQVQYVDFTGQNIQPVTPNIQLAAYGAAYDRNKKTIWWHGQAGSTRLPADDGIVFTEMDTSGTPTGQSFLGDYTTFPAPTLGADIAGGLELIPNPLGQPTIVYLVQANQGDSIVLSGGRFEYATGCGADGSFGGGSGAYQGNATFALTTGDTANPVPAGVTSCFPCFGVPSKNPINVPIALLNCGISLNFALYMDCAPSVPPNLGQAQFNLPIPAAGAKGANLGTQWIYFNPNNGKLDFSEAGAFYVTN